MGEEEQGSEARNGRKAVPGRSGLCGDEKRGLILMRKLVIERSAVKHNLSVIRSGPAAR